MLTRVHKARTIYGGANEPEARFLSLIHISIHTPSHPFSSIATYPPSKEATHPPI